MTDSPEKKLRQHAKMFALLRAGAAGQSKAVREKYLDSATSEQFVARGLTSFQPVHPTKAPPQKNAREKKNARFGFLPLDRFKS